MRKCLLATVAGFSLLSTAGWANVERPATPSQTGPNFNAAMDEANSWARTKIRAAHVGAARCSQTVKPNRPPGRIIRATSFMAASLSGT